MNNLIVAVLAISLAAVTSLAGIYYGGDAFMQAQARAAGSQHLEFMKQTENALALWSQRNGGYPRPAQDFPVACADASDRWCTLAELQSYLSPRFLNAIRPTKGNYDKYFYFDITATPAQANPFLVILLTPDDYRTCLMIENQRDTTVTSLRKWSVTGTAKSFCGDFGCMENDDSSLGAAASYPYFAYWRLTGKAGATDYPGPVCPTS